MVARRFDSSASTNGRTGRSQAQQSDALTSHGKVPAHILVPIRLDPPPQESLRMGFDLAAGYRPDPVVTVLHVLPPAADFSSVHWLDAIDRLHHAFSPATGAILEVLDQARRMLSDLVERTVPKSRHQALRLRCVCLMGEPAAEIARYAHDHSVDLVLLCKERKARLWPFRTSLTKRILQKSEKPVVLLQTPQAPTMPSK